MITFLSTTYLNNISKYIYYQYSKDNYHIVVKKILEVEPFIIDEDGKNIKILDNNYYVMEIVPIDKRYICRIHLDNNKNVIERYFIMSLKNDFINNIPVFKNLKISYVCCYFKKKIYNEKYLEDMYKNGIISEDEYEIINKEFKLLIKEINNNENEIFNFNYKNIIEKCEGK